MLTSKIIICRNGYIVGQTKEMNFQTRAKDIERNGGVSI